MERKIRNIAEKCRRVVGSPRNKWLMLAMMLAWMGVLAACTATGEAADKIADLEFTVVPEEEIPQELTKLIQEKKTNEFKLSYSADGKLYIVAGFGEKSTGGYSVRVNALYLTENAIVFDTDLLGPAKDEEVSQASSWPYIVVCTEDRPESVVFR